MSTLALIFRTNPVDLVTGTLTLLAAGYVGREAWRMRAFTKRNDPR
jgi:hypothetical protein